MTTKKGAKNTKIFVCEKCNFKCSKTSDFDRHILTRKHEKTTDDNKKNAAPERDCICCNCKKSYSDRISLWRHKQKCVGFTDSKPTENQESTSAPDLVMVLVKQNQEFKDLIITQNKQIIELSKNGGMTNYHNTINNTNSHNKTFNLQFFLNETCKDAMNITDFVSSLKLTLQDLEKVGELGYAEGISRMFVRGLNDLDVTKRPIHCSDLKREILHIKDKDKWERDANQDKLKKAIKDLSTKNIMLLDDWQKENPGCKDYNNQKNDIYLKMMVESLGPADDVAEKKDFGKIIRTIAKNTIIDRGDGEPKR